MQLNINNPEFLQEISLHQQVIASKRLATYYGDIGVGKGTENQQDKVQTFKMLFDTGSCEFWIPGQQCSTARCMTHTRYQTSNTFQNFNGAMMSIQYLSGKVQGQLAKETIILNDIEVPNQVIGISQDLDIPLLDDVTWDGILGLAYPNQNLKNQKILPLFDNMMSQKILTNKGEKNQFAYYLGPDNGAISFGGADMSYKRSIKEEFLFAPITEENYWTINLRDINKIDNQQKTTTKQRFLQIDDKKEPACPQGCKTIIDTGTYLIYGPQEKVNELLSDITLDNCNNKNDLPNFEIELFGELKNGKQELIKLTMTPEDYILHFKIDGADDCVIGIVPDNVDSGWTFGQVFLKSFYTLFDRDNNRIGFVRANPNPQLKMVTNSSQVIMTKAQNNTENQKNDINSNQTEMDKEQNESDQKQEQNQNKLEDIESNENTSEGPNLLEQNSNDIQTNSINGNFQNLKSYNGALQSDYQNLNYPYALQINDFS